MQKFSFFLLVILAGAVLIGCRLFHPLRAGSEPLPRLTPTPPLKRVWLPLHQQPSTPQHRIIAVGRYPLPEAIVIPAGLSPFPSALVQEPERNAQWSLQVQIFFPARQENAVLKWAQSSPALIGSRGHAQWKYQTSEYTTRTGLSKRPPPDAPLQWMISGALFTRRTEYGVIWDSSLPLTANERQVVPTLYDRASPVKAEPHLVAIAISYKHYPL